MTVGQRLARLGVLWRQLKATKKQTPEYERLERLIRAEADVLQREEAERKANAD